MTRKEKTAYVCQDCGHEALKWMGRCPDCGQWSSMVEEVRKPFRKETRPSVMSRAESINAISVSPEVRLKTGLSEFDRTLGGGVVPGSLILIGGDPGIGKSTIILQVLDRLARQNFRALYLSGEESALQIKLRAERLGIRSDSLYVMTGTCIEDFFDRMAPLNPDIVAVDSIQTFYTDDVTSAPGSVGQVREVASRLMAYAKGSGTSVFLVGHVTKEGAIAGPKVLEHLVDTVLYFEGDRGHAFRILRAVKNRYGSTNEIGVFEMKDSGLDEVGNPSRIFLQERPEGVPGSVVISCIEGTRPLLVEIQALVGPSPLGMPRRTAIGVDHNRISLLVAVLGKRLGMELGDQDIFVNVAGGLRVDEPAADLGIVSAMMSSFLNRPVSRDLVVFGEVGLAGEVRGVNQPAMRIKEAKKLGFSHCLLPKSNLEGSKTPGQMKLSGVGSVQDLYELLFE
ncbi:MAG: DNA repair protein RadA [Proteobacteria bacterium]|nr:DNA repair protein RadA [Desulfobacterales bacterium]MBL6968042.1 DNA repair protein RadA [Desulfobacteraceae bacterium]MBU0735319.1 DNA repair protein RadA [Pseudomonadota bacterium]MBL7101197.1 DNA repair protein RadA [Desulfobacteraceae bacterium]MBL7171926.1 DNA repair protein RadA [Desulfobacteraceae bacterium]